MTSRRCAFNFLLSATVLAVTFLRPVCAQPPKGDTGLTVEDVVKLSQTGIPEELIITKIKKNGKAFDLNRDELVELKKLGVSENVIKFLLDPSQPYVPPNPPVNQPAPVTPSGPKPSEAKKYPGDARAAQVPGDTGLYLFLSNAPIRVDIKLLLGAEGGKSLMKKNKNIAYLVGPASKTKIKDPIPAFYMRPPESIEIEQVVLVALAQKNDRREIDLGDLKPEVTRSFDSVEVASKLFKITTTKLAPGEYMFFIVGSAEPSKGIHGKGYDFEIEDSQEQKK